MLLGLFLLPMYALGLSIVVAVLCDQLIAAWHSGAVLWCAVAVVIGLALLCLPARKRRRD